MKTANTSHTDYIRTGPASQVHWRKWLTSAILLVFLAGGRPLPAQDSAVPVATNEMTQADDPGATDLTQAADGSQDELSSTNSPADTNQVFIQGPDGRARRRSRQAQNRLRRPAQPGYDARSTAAGTNSNSSPLDFSAFRLVVDRNIFDPNRAPRRGPTVAVRTVDAFTLVGTMSYEKGIFAFFDGSSSDYKKVLKPKETIAGYKVISISPDSVKLMFNTNVVELSVGTQMRRRDDGAWERSAATETYAASTASSPSTSPSDAATSGAESDILKKMMLRREKE